MGKKNQILHNIEIGEIVAEGKCIAKVNDLAIFVTGVAPGDVVDLRITRKKSKYREAVPIHFHEYGSVRQEPFCDYFGVCGGCKWQHIQYAVQTEAKEKQASDNLKRIGGIDGAEFLPIIKSEQTEYYRNKLEFTFSNSRWLTSEEISSGEEFERNALGFHVPKRFDKIVDIGHCHLQPEPSNSIRNGIRKYALDNQLPFFDIRNKEGLMRTVVIRTSNIGQTMVIVQFFENDQEQIMGLMNFLRNEFPEITSLNYVHNPKGNDTFNDLEVVNVFGTPYIEEKLESLTYRIGPKTFYQTNSDQTINLYGAARDFAKLTGNEVVYDLYTGAGTIANFVAEKAQKVIGIEYVESAIEDAKVNSEINDIENTLFFAGDMKDVLDAKFIETHGRPDVIITDPPRAGMHEDVVNTILAAEPHKIVYVSCNPATQARDVKLMSEKYKVIASQAVDMFPHTHHVENVVLMELTVQNTI